MSPPKKTLKTLGGAAGKSSRTGTPIEEDSKSFQRTFNVNSSFGEPSSKSTGRNMTVGLSDDELVRMDIKDLNDYLRHLSKDAANNARRRRRLLKNRGYAQSTRTKRMTTIEEFTARKTELKDEIAAIKRETERLRGRRDQLRMTRSRMERMRSVTNSGLPAMVKTEDTKNEEQ